MHAGLDVLGFVPGLGAVPDLVNAGIYGLEGDALAAMTAAVAAVPGVGDAAKAGTMVAKSGKAIARGAAEEAAKKAAKETAERVEKETAERAGKRRTAEGAVERSGRQAADASGSPPGRDGGYVVGGGRKGPCDHVKRGQGEGKYRGGAHSETSQPIGDQRDSHPMPPRNVSPLPPEDGPAIQMERIDHRATSSNGNKGMAGAVYRQTVSELLQKGQARQAMAMEVVDVRRVARTAGDPRRYNEALREMLAYFKCLHRHGQL